MILIVALIGSLVGARKLSAQGPPDGLAVRIVNSISLLFKSVDEPGRAPFQVETQLPSGSPVCGAEGFCSTAYNFPAVPPGKRLVIQQVSAYFTTKQGATILPLTLVASTLGLPTQLALPATRQNTGLVFGAFCLAAAPCETWLTNSLVHYYVEPNSYASLIITEDQAHQVPIFKRVTMHGYYVSLP